MDAITIGIVALTATVVGALFVYDYEYKDSLNDRKFMEKGMDKPVIWIYLNSSDVNSRSWADFMARSNRVMNLPFLNLCYETVVKQNSDIYRVEVIAGLSDLAVRLGGWNAMPVPLQNPEAVVREPELNWIRATILAKFGGLWLSPASISIAPFGPLSKKHITFFGVDTVPAYRTSDTLPALNAIWAPVPNHPMWVAWARTTAARLERRSGGSEFRHDEKSDLADALRKYNNEITYIAAAEVSRKGASLKRIELEDLLAAGTEGALPFTISRGAVYVPIPYPEILERTAFEWFLRMSEEQILESDLVLSYLFRKALN